MAKNRLKHLEQKILDPTRKRCYAAAPEEIVRQRLVQHLVRLGFPKSHIVIEQKLENLVHLTAAKLPDRRVDLLVYSKQEGSLGPPMSPLLLIECKAVSLTTNALKQVMGYNLYVKSPCFGIVNSSSCMLAVQNSSKQKTEILHLIPKYKDLIEMVN